MSCTETFHLDLFRTLRAGLTVDLDQIEADGRVDTESKAGVHLRPMWTGELPTDDPAIPSGMSVLIRAWVEDVLRTLADSTRTRLILVGFGDPFAFDPAEGTGGFSLVTFDVPLAITKLPMTGKGWTG